MQLSSLLADLLAVVAICGDTNLEIVRITADSRQVIPGALFVAYRGLDVDGHRFIGDAMTRGAAAVIGELPYAALSDHPASYIQVSDGRVALAWLCATWYGHPSRSMALVGITGTDGKTTTANLLFNILRAADCRVGLISTVSAVIGERTHDTGLHTTTPDAPDVQRYLAEMRDAGTDVAVLETTSHGLAQQRVTGCAFDVAVVTNITHEHLDFHGTYEAYRAAKASLFRSLTGNPGFLKKTRFSPLPKTAVLNCDDSSLAFLAAIPAERVITYGIANRKSQIANDRSFPPILWDLTASDIQHTPSGIEFDVQWKDVTASPRGGVAFPPLHLCTSLVGDYNISNALAATAAALALGIAPPAIQAGVRTLRGIPGRLERIVRGQPFIAIVDFAHTPNALAQVLAAAHTFVRPGGRVIVVFGCAGLRDRAKRRLMGEVAAHGADFTVITAEDPRTEDLAAIMAETAAALTAGGRIEAHDFVQIPDRQRAILSAVQRAQPGDVLLVCGKGHEQSMCFGVVEHLWRDQDALAWALGNLNGTAAAAPPFVLPTWA